MKPLRLVFNGVNSFSSPATIDFERLTASGLFGIFGDTGSGKSTILDSINFALYGDVDRSKKKTDIINYNCDQAEVEFTFDILLGGKRVVYRVERSIKKKNGLGKAMLYEDDGNGERCIADNTTSVNARVESILGLGAEDFRKCIALPQGEFAQFVKSSPSERFKLIERLFSLNKYGDGLREKLSAAENEADKRLTEVKAKYDVLGDVSDESVALLEQNLKLLEAENKKLEAQCLKSEEDVAALKKHYDVCVELADTEEQLKRYNSEADRFERLRVLLKNLPAAERVSESVARRDEAKKIIEDCVREEAEAVKRLSAAKQKLDGLMSKKASSDIEGSLEKLTARLALLQSSVADITSLRDEKAKLTSLRSEFLKSAEKKNKLMQLKQEAAARREKLSEEYNNCKVPDISQVLEDRFKPVILREEYSKQLTYLGELREAIKGYDDRSRLYLFLREELTDRLNYLKTQILSCGTSDLDVKKMLGEVDGLSAQKEKLLTSLNKANDEAARAEREYALADSNCTKIKSEGEQVAERVKKLQERLVDIFGADCKDYREEADRARQEVKNLKSAREELEKGIDASRAEISSIELLLGEVRARRAAAERESENLDKLIAGNLNEFGFSNIQECIGLIAEAKTYGDAQAALKEYDEKMYALTARREKLLADKGADTVTKEQLEHALSELADLKSRAKEKHAEVKLVQARFNENGQKLKIRKSLEGELKERTLRRELIYQLKELVKGNRFLEYIAGEYLADISKSASNTLLKLTMGRYYLTYTDTFYVADNYNEGRLRGVNTLSGGETFLVSLSLALALSSSICRSSMRSIEFFFLDEGFGTLDESLVDTVMDTLEKLRSSDFTIGIISHVEELKHRIDSKITVNKATETHGSTVTVSV